MDMMIRVDFIKKLYLCSMLFKEPKNSQEKLNLTSKKYQRSIFWTKKRYELNPFCLSTLLSRSSFCFAKQMLPNKLKWVIKMQSAHSIDAIINNFPVTRDRITWFVDQSSQTTESIGKKLRFYLMRFFTLDVLSNFFYSIRVHIVLLSHFVLTEILLIRSCDSVKKDGKGPNNY